MDAILLVFSEFSEELLWIEISLLSFFGAVYLYAYLIKRRESVSPEFVPAALVKEYLDRVDQNEQQIRFQLFGETTAPAQNAPMMASPAVSGAAVDAALVKELEAVRAQLATADGRAQEYEKQIEALRAAGGGGDGAEELAKAQKAWDEEKAKLQKQVDEAKASAGSGSGDNGELQKEADEMRARLEEYEVIEDDLANLKQYQIENKKLRDQLEEAGIKPTESEITQSEKVAGAVAVAAAATTVAGSEAAAEESTTVSGEASAEEETTTVAADAPESEESTTVSGDEPAEEEKTEVAAEAAEEPPEEEAPAEEAEAPPEEEPIEETAEASSEDEAGEEESGGGDGDDDDGDDSLLSEFEKMLAS